MTAKRDGRGETLETKLHQVTARRQRIAAWRAALLSSRARKDETRQKIQVGAVILAKAERADFDERQLKRWLDKGLTRADDRALLGLS